MKKGDYLNNFNGSINSNFYGYHHNISFLNFYTTNKLGHEYIISHTKVIVCHLFFIFFWKVCHLIFATIKSQKGFIKKKKYILKKLDGNLQFRQLPYLNGFFYFFMGE